VAVSSPTLREALAHIVGRGELEDDATALAAHAVDGVTPRWVARPGSVEEVSRLLSLAAAEGLAVAPQGSRSSLSLGAPPSRLDLVLDCRRLHRVVDYVAEDMVASVQAGMTLEALAALLSRRGQRLPLDPPGGMARTVGGVLATNGSGLLRLRYGTARDLLLGVRFVQADGTVTWGGARVVKSVTGYDVPKLLVGSLGTLGVIVEATLRLHPIPPAAGSWHCAFPSVERAGAFVAALLDTAVEPTRVALVVSRPTGAVVAVSIESVEEAVASQGRAVARLASEHGAGTEAVPETFWPTLALSGRGVVDLRVTGEPSRLAARVVALDRLARGIGLAVSVTGEGASGVLRASLDGDLDGGRLDREVLRPLRDLVADEGGSVVVERAQHELKSSLDVWGPVADGPLAVMRRLKAEFDPLGVLNPGRFVGGL
jgi:glycolate oxidase FAD binding subunit